MRAAALAVVSMIALAACSPGGGSSGGGAPASGASSSASSTAPAQGAGVSFKQEAAMTIHGQRIPEVIYHDGAKIRTEMNGPMGNQINVINGDTREGFTIMTMGGRTIATRMTLPDNPSTPSSDAISQMRAQMSARTRQIGACSAGGETGTEWEMNAPTTGDTTQRSMCVTSDGIMIQMKQGGDVVFDTTSVQRGAQDASLFAPPAGVQFTTVNTPSQSQINDMVARAKAAAAAHGAP